MLIESEELRTRTNTQVAVLKSKIVDKDKELKTLIMGEIQGLEMGEVILQNIEEETRISHIVEAR